MRKKPPKLLMLYMVIIGLALEYLREELLLKLLDTPFSDALCNHLWYAIEVFLFFTEWIILERRQVSTAFKKGIRAWGGTGGHGCAGNCDSGTFLLEPDDFFRTCCGGPFLCGACIHGFFGHLCAVG